jgi:hypothetical protein
MQSSGISTYYRNSSLRLKIFVQEGRDEKQHISYETTEEIGKPAQHR